MGALDVPRLRALVATAEQNHDGIALAAEVHPEAWSKLDAKFVHALAHGTGVAEVAQANPRDALTNSVAGLSISKSSKPMGEGLATVRAGGDPDFLLIRHIGTVA